MFILLPSLLRSKSQQKSRNKSPTKAPQVAAASTAENQFESFEQLFTSLSIAPDDDDEVMEISNTPCSLDSMNK